MTTKKTHRQRRRLRMKALIMRMSFKLLVALGQIAAFFLHILGD